MTALFSLDAILFPLEAETRGIIVRANTTYLPEQSNPAQGRWFWSYHIRIENACDMTVQLLTRHWEITDARGAMHIVDGEGVIGAQPVLNPTQCYDYVSGCPLPTTSGYMDGFYTFLGEDGSTFNVDVPRLTLAEPVAAL